MSEIMKGNFKTKRPVGTSEESQPETLEARFEREALKRLGGSIAFVKKQKVHWGDEEESSEDNDSKTGDGNPA